ncbi:hypothetical protein SDJN02_16570 [Cucurbita argyrosperma subsp. argyrosperma]|nr:hypothetical protein SDJN02_16570 [Cucurbita argyrosperma subsp. argyrosperma]
MASFAARAILRSSSGKATALLSAGARAGSARSTFRISSERSFSQCAVCKNAGRVLVLLQET